MTRTVTAKPAEISPFVKEIQEVVAKQHFKLGQMITHKNLGKGKIIQFLDNNIWLIQFINGEKRKIDSIYCINNAIIITHNDGI